MKHRFKSNTIINHILEFCVRNFGIWLFFEFIICASCLFTPRPNGTIGIAQTPFLLSLAASGLTATVLTSLFTLLWHRRSLVLRFFGIVFMVMCILICLGDVWLTLILQVRWNDKVFALISGTTPSETSEFFTVYFRDFSLAVVVAGVLIIYAVGDLLRLMTRSISPLMDRAVKGFPNLCMIILIAVNVLSGFDCYLYFNDINHFKIKYRNAVIVFVRNACNSFTTLNDVRSIARIFPEAKGTLRDSVNSPTKIIWVIGESDNRSHHPLYGYSKNTTPNLKNEFEKGNILIYDAASYYGFTTQMLDIMFSLHNLADKDTDFSNYPIVTMVMRNAGYMVRLHDNQWLLTDRFCVNDLTSFSVIDRPEISALAFNYRNSVEYPYDYTLVEKEGAKFLKDTTGHTLEIFHLIGEHVDAAERYPKNERIFQASDYAGYTVNGKPLASEPREYLAHYDNALRHVDKSLGLLMEMVKDQDAVIIYHADHGEEMYDWRMKQGRSFGYGKLPGTVEALLHVPFYVYTTPTYRLRHPEQYKKLKRATTRKLSLLYFSHFLLDVANVDSKWLRPELSPMSDKWSNPPRLFDDSNGNELDFDRHTKPNT